jgi:hypothetical protein
VDVSKSWIPGSIAGEASDGPGMTSHRNDQSNADSRPGNDHNALVIPGQSQTGIPLFVIPGTAAGRNPESTTGDDFEYSMIQQPHLKRIDTCLPGVCVIEPVVHGDARGYFHCLSFRGRPQAGTRNPRLVTTSSTA